MAHRYPILILDSDNEMENAPTCAPERPPPTNIVVYNSRALLGENGIQDMIPQVPKR